MHNTPMFSLIMATYGRTEEVQNFLATVSHQTHPNFELIIVDQNHDDRLVPLIGQYESTLSILHLRSALKGLSVSRNLGISNASGDILLFPDDDCEYPPVFLQRLAQLFIEHKEAALISVRIIDKHRHTPVMIKCPVNSCRITLRNMWFTITSGSFAVRRSVVEYLEIQFDQRFGLGGIYKAAEEIDFAARILKKRVVALYFPDVVVFHPEKERTETQENIVRLQSYAYGTGAVCAKLLLKNQIISVVPFFISRLIRPFIMCLFYMGTNHYQYQVYRAYLSGRIRGFYDFGVTILVKAGK